MIKKEEILESVVKMFEVNMGVKRGEKILIVSDFPTASEWVSKSSAELAEMVERTLLAKIISEIAAERFPECNVEFFTYPSVGRHGVEPGGEVAEKMKSSNVVTAITTYSLTHTKAREEATKAGVRIASMPTFMAYMFRPGGPMAVDYRQVAQDSKRFADLLTEAKKAKVTSPAGTDIELSLEGRKGIADTGILTEAGAFGNLPAGEAFIAPVEGTANGRVVVEAGWFPGLKENMAFTFEKGYVTGIIGGGRVGDEFRKLLDPARREEPYISRRNLAELGIGTNPNAKRPDNVLEAEKIKGTVHLAVGSNYHIGGKVMADVHQDFVIPRPTLILDDKIVIRDGKWLI